MCSHTQLTSAPPASSSQILLRHAHLFTSSLLKLLARAPASTWLPITPQLFTHLRNPHAPARAAACQLLQGIAHVAAAAVLYPVMADASTEELEGRPPELQVPVAQFQGTCHCIREAF